MMKNPSSAEATIDRRQRGFVTTPNICADETARLCALHSLGILDSAPDERFDRVTRMASRLLDVPTSLVSLVDEDRQWFKSRVGLNATETPRDISFCGHAILGDEPFVIEDARLDERFQNNPLVTGEPRIRFYAGCPIVAGDGSKLGTLCVIDQKPRTVSPQDIESLQDLAAMVEREIAAIYLASVDELTGISNRRGFTTVAQHYMYLSKEYRDPMSLVFIDLNDFKKINDKYGHAEGDYVLRTLANVIKENLRGSDLVARIGGDEFVVLLNNAVPQNVQRLIETIMVRIERHDLERKLGYKIRFSAGIIAFDANLHKTTDHLLAEGDKLMYQNKRRGKLVKLPSLSRRNKHS